MKPSSETLAELFGEVLDQPIAPGLSGREALPPFMRLSVVLVGRGEMQAWLGRAYLKTLADWAAAPVEGTQRSPAYTADDIAQVLTRFVALEHASGGDAQALALQVQQQLLLAPEPGIADVTRSIAALWYCAGLIEFKSPLGFMVAAAPVQTYSSALAWQAVGGNPMGIPGPYYGNWAYPAPVLIVPPDAAPGTPAAPPVSPPAAAA